MFTKTDPPAAKNDNIRCLKLRPAGMFSNVNEVVEQVLSRSGSLQRHAAYAYISSKA